jgi:chemotaxis-related protein WspD
MTGRQHVGDRTSSLFAAAASHLLDAELPPDYLVERARHYAQRKEITRPGARSVVIFRLGAEWLALPTGVFGEIAPLRPAHSLPHRRDRIVAGVTNIRGELLVCVSLAAALGLDRDAGASPNARLAVVNRSGDRFAFAADEIAGLQRFDDADLTPVPATLAHAQATYTRGMLAWQERSVGVLDDQLLFYTLSRSLA